VFNQELYASAFARAVGLMRDGPGARDQQVASLRALVALAELSAAALRLYDDILSVDDVAMPSEVPSLPMLVQRMQAHRITELMVGRQSEPVEVLALLRGLAAEPGEGPSIKERLRDVGSKRIMVILEQVESSARARSVTQAFDMMAIEAAAAAPPVERDPLLAEWDRATTGEMRGVHLELIEDPEPPRGAPVVTSRVEAFPAPKPDPDVSPPPMHADTPLGAALSAVVLDPYGGAVLNRLTALAEQVARSLGEDKTDAALRALAIVVDLETGAPEGSPRNSYGIVLKRVLTRELLAQVAQCLLTPALMDAAGKLMRRSRGEGAELLLGLLVSAEGLRERKAYLTVLRTIPEATTRVLAMLNHDQWFVVRNVAELLGDQGIEDAVPALGRVLRHSDARVQRAAVIALAKIGSAATVEPLRRALKEGTAELRALIAASIGGPKARALAMPLVLLAESETNPEVLREYYRALGRIGAPEAVQALANAAAPGGKLVGRKSTALRLAAVEGLRLAGAKAALAGLAGDGEKAVREAARAPMR
jgi:HEAT repeat protein